MASEKLPACPSCAEGHELFTDDVIHECYRCGFRALFSQWRKLAEQAAKAKAFDKFTFGGKDVHAAAFLAEARAEMGLED